MADRQRRIDDQLARIDAQQADDDDDNEMFVPDDLNVDMAIDPQYQELVYADSEGVGNVVNEPICICGHTVFNVDFTPVPYICCGLMCHNEFAERYRHSAGAEGARCPNCRSPMQLLRLRLNI